MDFSLEDHLDAPKYNHIVWKGLMGDKPHPSIPSGLDLRENRAQLLQHYLTTNAEQTANHESQESAPKPAKGYGRQ
jgi:hypothetical protein